MFNLYLISDKKVLTCAQTITKMRLKFTVNSKKEQPDVRYKLLFPAHLDRIHKLPVKTILKREHLYSFLHKKIRIPTQKGHNSILTEFMTNL